MTLEEFKGVIERAEELLLKKHADGVCVALGLSVDYWNIAPHNSPIAKGFEIMKPHIIPEWNVYWLRIHPTPIENKKLRLMCLRIFEQWSITYKTYKEY